MIKVVVGIAAFLWIAMHLIIRYVENEAAKWEERNNGS